MAKITVTCRNKNIKKRKNYGRRCANDLYPRDIEAGCRGCYFFKFHCGNERSGDWAHCACPVAPQYGDKFKIVEATPAEVKRV